MMSSDNQDYFDFKAEDELPQEHSGQMRDCPHCSKPIPADSLFCLYCGEPVSPVKQKNWMILVAILVLAAFIMWVIIL